MTTTFRLDPVSTAGSGHTPILAILQHSTCSVREQVLQAPPDEHTRFWILTCSDLEHGIADLLPGSGGLMSQQHWQGQCPGKDTLILSTATLQSVH